MESASQLKVSGAFRNPKGAHRETVSVCALSKGGAPH